MDAFTSCIVCFACGFAVFQTVFYFWNKRQDKKLAELLAELERRQQTVRDEADRRYREADEKIKPGARANIRDSYTSPQGARGPTGARWPKGSTFSNPQGPRANADIPATTPTPASDDDGSAAMLLASAALFSSSSSDDAPSPPSFLGGGGTFDGGGSSGDGGSSSDSSSSSSSSDSSSSSSDSSSSSSGSDW